MDLTTLLVNCSTTDNQLRKSSEEQLRQLRKADPAGFICHLAQILADESKPEQARFLASLIFKNTIRSSDPTFSKLWISLPAETKAAVRNLGLSALASNFKNARKGAAQVVAAIAALELPRKEWHEVLTVLGQNAQGTNHLFKVASLETLGYICEEIEKSALSDSEVDTMLNAIVTNAMESIESEEVKLVALTALHACLPFCEKNFKIEAEKNVLLANIINNCQSSNDEIKVKAMQCLLEVVRCFYDYIGGATLDTLGRATINEMKKKDNEEVGMFAIELWSSICDEEIDRMKRNSPTAPCRNYIQAAAGVLVPLLLECLKNMSDEDETEWDMSVASACCLSLMAEIVKDPIIPVVIEYVGKNLTVAEWKSKKAGIMAFASILKGPNKSTMNVYVTQALPTFMTLLQDEKPQVREAAAWAFNKLAENTSETLIMPQIFPTVIATFIASLKDIPKVSNQICYAINNLAPALRAGESQPTSLLSTVFKEVLEGLWENAFRGDAFGETVNLAHSSFIAFTNIILYAANDVVATLEMVFKMLIEMFASTVHGTFTIPTRSHDFQGYLCTALNPVCIKLGPKIDSKTTETMVDLIIESFKTRNTVYDEGIQAISGLIMGIGKNFQPFMGKVGPYLAYSLKNTDDTTLCRVAVGCVDDLSRALEEGVGEYLRELVPILMDILRNPESDRGLKLNTITTLGDLALAASKMFGPFFKDLLEILKSAAMLSLQPPQEDDPELPAYIRNLKECLIETYTSIVFAVKETEDTSVFDPYVNDIFGYLEQLSTQAGNDLDFLRLVVGLVGDLAGLYGKKIQQLLTVGFVPRIIGALESSTNKEHKKIARWSQNVINKQLSN